MIAKCSPSNSGGMKAPLATGQTWQAVAKGRGFGLQRILCPSLLRPFLILVVALLLNTGNHPGLLLLGSGSVWFGRAYRTICSNRYASNICASSLEKMPFAVIMMPGKSECPPK